MPFLALQSTQLEALFMNPTSQKTLIELAVIILKGSGATLRGLFLFLRRHCCDREEESVVLLAVCQACNAVGLLL